MTLTKQQQQTLVLAIMLTLGGGYVYWNYLMKPTLERIKTSEQRYEELVQKIEAAERQTRRLAAVRAEKLALEQELLTLEKQLPKDTDLPNIIRTLTREAVQESLIFNRITPKPPVNQQYFQAYPFEMQLSGTLQSLVRFLSSLGQQDRIYQAQNITLATSSSGADFQSNIKLSITLTILTYTYVG